MNRIMVGLLTVLVVGGWSWAEDRKFDAAALGKAVAPFLEEGTFFIAHIDLTRVDPDKLITRASAVSGAAAKDLEHAVTERDRERLKELREAGARDLFLVFGMDDLFTKGGALLLPAPEGADRKAIIKGLGHRGDSAVVVGNVVLAGDPSTVERLQKKKAIERSEVVPALAAAGDGVVQLVLVLPAPLRRSLEEAVPQLPDELGGGDITSLTRSFRWAAAGIQAEPCARVQVTIDSPDAGSAKKLREALERAMRTLAARKEVRAVLPAAGELVPHLVPQVDGDHLQLVLDEKAIADLVRPLVPKVRSAATRTQSANNMKQLLLAMHSFHDTYTRFPAAANYSATGKPLLSWRVHLLPFLDQNELYKEFHLDEPWDSEHNKKLLMRMPKVFDSTGDAKRAAAGKTTYIAPRGTDTMFPPGKEGLRVRDVTDGTSNTIFLVDADNSLAVPWTKPEDLEVDLSNPAKGLSFRFDGVTLVGFVDGSVHFLSQKINKATLKGLFTRNGGEVIDLRSP
jgi:hypothetical protein